MKSKQKGNIAFDRPVDNDMFLILSRNTLACQAVMLE